MTSDKISQILKQHKLDDSDILLFEHSPNSEEYARITDFYNKALNNFPTYEHNPSVFYIQQETVHLRAFAYRVNGLGMIAFSPPFLEYIRKSAFQENSILINLLENSKDSSTIFEGVIRQFVYDFSLHFIFYHELGHLIQNRTGKYQAIDLYKNGNLETFDFLIHALETDADEFAALSSFQHIFDYAIRIHEQKATINNRALADYCITCLAGVILVMFKLHPNFNEFYLRDKKHPHPSIRVAYFSLVFVEYLNQSAVLHFGLEKFNNSDVIFTALNVVHEHLRISEQDERVYYAQEMIKNNMDEIMEYYSELREKQKELSDLAVSTWNKSINNKGK